ncbi:UL-16 binding protein 5-like, partial [Eptesicus fuscus]|uniref:UL-16 binding protein 5-like n=1 Tax=Eptesicus fuscus TaxID=29078 RepID=UPI00240417C8
MERSVGLSPVFLLWLLLWEPAASRCARSLVYKFTLTPNEQAWCEIQGQANGNTFLHYTCGSNKVTLISVPEMNATQAWNQQRDTLQYVMDELRKTLLNNKPKIPATSHPLSLQGSMMCKEESSGPTSASIEFGSDGQISLYLDSKKENWTVLHGEGRLLHKTFSSDRDMTHLLVKTSAGDCKKWLEQVLCLQDEILNTTAASPTATATVPPKANMPIVLILSIII